MLTVAGLAFQTHAQTSGAETAWHQELPGATLAGAGRLTYWGLKVYDASLWVAPGFRAGDFTQHGFALELHYLRDFKAIDIAKRSLDEIRRQKSLGLEQARDWQRLLERSLPDVRSGDRITGIYQPALGMRLLTNGRLTGEIRDPELARLFFGIWLSPLTSEPALRQALLGGTGS